MIKVKKKRVKKTKKKIQKNRITEIIWILLLVAFLIIDNFLDWNSLGYNKKYDEPSDDTIKNEYLLKLPSIVPDFCVVQIKDDTELKINSNYEIKGFMIGKSITKSYKNKDLTIPIVDTKIVESICDEEIKNQIDMKEEPIYNEYFYTRAKDENLLIEFNNLKCFQNYSLLKYSIYSKSKQKIQITSLHFSISNNGNIIEEKDSYILKDLLTKDGDSANDFIRLGKLKTIYGDDMILTVNYEIDEEEKSSKLEYKIDVKQDYKKDN